MRYKVYNSDNKKFYVIDESTGFIMLYVSNRRIAEHTCEQMNQVYQKQKDQFKTH